jgi:hypothetical protein
MHTAPKPFRRHAASQQQNAKLLKSLLHRLEKGTTSTASSIRGSESSYLYHPINEQKPLKHGGPSKPRPAKPRPAKAPQPHSKSPLLDFDEVKNSYIIANASIESIITQNKENAAGKSSTRCR